MLRLGQTFGLATSPPALATPREGAAGGRARRGADTLTRATFATWPLPWTGPRRHRAAPGSPGEFALSEDPITSHASMSRLPQHDGGRARREGEALVSKRRAPPMATSRAAEVEHHRAAASTMRRKHMPKSTQTRSAAAKGEGHRLRYFNVLRPRQIRRAYAASSQGIAAMLRGETVYINGEGRPRAILLHQNVCRRHPRGNVRTRRGEQSTLRWGKDVMNELFTSWASFSRSKPALTAAPVYRDSPGDVRFSRADLSNRAVCSFPARFPRTRGLDGHHWYLAGCVQ